MGFFVLDSKPSFGVNKSLMIADLDIGLSVIILVSEYAMYAVIGFYIIDDLKTSRLEIGVNIFIGSHIERTFQNKRNMTLIDAAPRLVRSCPPCNDFILLEEFDNIFQRTLRLLIHRESDTHRLCLFRGNENRASLTVHSSALRVIAIIHFTALIESSFTSFRIVGIGNSGSDRLTLKLSEVQKIVPHHTPLFCACVERLRQRINGNAIAVKLVRDVEILSHVSAETVILLHNDPADKSVTSVLHHLDKGRTVSDIFTTLAIVAIDTIRFIAYEPDTLLLLGIYRQRVIALKAVTYGTADINRRQSLLLNCLFHFYRPPLCK